MDEIERIEEERFVESLICLWIQPDAPEWIVDYARQELRKQRGLLKEQETVVRCGDCVNGEPYENGIMCNCEPHDKDWYCADGKRKESSCDL